MYRICTFVFLIVPCAGWASFELLPLSSRQHATCGVCSAGEAGSLWLNPASSTALTVPCFSCTHTQLWSLPELSLSSMVYTYRFDAAAVSAGLSNYGFIHYRENTGCLSFAWLLDRSLSAGVNLKWMHRSIADLSAQSAVSIDGGLLMEPVDRVWIEMSIHNLNSPTVGTETLVQDLRAGFVYRPAPGFTAGISLLKRSEYPIELSAGEELHLSDWLLQRAGVGRNPTQMSFGFGVVWSRLQFDYAAIIHPVLGMTHSVSFSIKASHVE